MYMQRGCDHTVIRVDIIQLNSVFKQCPGLTSHQVFRLADMGEKVRISAAADRLVEGHQRNISGNLDVQRGQQVVKVSAGGGFRRNKCRDPVLGNQVQKQILVITEFFVLIQKFHQLDGIIRQVQGEGRFLDPFNPVFHGERVPVCGGNKGDPLLAQLVQMTETELPCGFVVRNHIIGIQARKIAVQQHQRIILQLHGQQLVAEEGLILGKQDNSGDIQFQASLKQIIFHSGIVALENMADISVLRKNGLDAVDHRQGKRMQAISVMDAGMAVWEEGIGASLTKGGRRTDLVTKVPLWGKRVIIPSLFNSLRALDTVMRLTPYFSMSWYSVGILSPGSSCPSLIWRRISSLIF